MIAPPWLKILAPLLVAGLIFGAGYKVATWKWSGVVTKANAERDAAIKEAAERRALEATWRADIQRVNEELQTMAFERDEAQRNYREAMDTPPEVVVEYRDRWKTIPTAIKSTDCNEAVAEMLGFIQSLPERPQ